MKTTIGNAMLLTKHMTAAVRLKRRLADHEKQQRSRDDLLSAVSSRGETLGAKLREMFARKEPPRFASLLPEGIEPDPDSGVVEGIIPLEKLPPGLKEMLDKLAAGDIDGASVRISELNPDGSVKSQKIIGDPSDFGEAPDSDVPRH